MTEPMKETTWMIFNFMKAELIWADHLYYGLDAPAMSDREYDFKMKELIDMENMYPHLITPDSPTQVPGYDRLRKVTKEH